MTNSKVSVIITPEEFQHYWKRPKEKTSSFIYGIHFGHYKAAAQSNDLSGFFAKQVTLVARTGCPPERWSRGLAIMLEKIAGLVAGQ